MKATMNQIQKPNTERLGKPTSGMALLGLAKRSGVWPREARRNKARTGGAWHGSARLYGARQCKVRLGEARYGWARLGVVLQG